jgi:two-component system, OmpR family, sensor kinase
VLWYSLVLTLVVALYGGAVIYQSWRSMTSGVDAELDVYAREVVRALRPVEGGRFDLDLPADASAYFFRREGVRPYYVIRSATGALVDQSDPDLDIRRAATDRREVSVQSGTGATVVVGRDIGDLRSEQRSLILDVLLAGTATLALAIIGGWFVAGRALAPIKRISETARAMSGGDLNARIEVERTESELEQVASTLNEAFDRLRLAVEQERRFTADASHELRTPISVLRAESEWALDRERTVSQYRAALTVCHRAALRMQDAVQRMLALARAEADEGTRERTPVAIHTLVADVLGWLAPIAHERGVHLALEGDPIVVPGDAEQLREALNNVLANAILYNKAGGSVTVSTRAIDNVARIEVVDTGIGMPAEAIPHVFDRFFRVDRSRSRDGQTQAALSGGSGLGLSIARAIVTAHGGDIACTSEPGTGSVFVISLPLLTSKASLCSPTQLL